MSYYQKPNADSNPSGWSDELALQAVEQLEIAVTSKKQTTVDDWRHPFYELALAWRKTTVRQWRDLCRDLQKRMLS